MAIHLKVQRQQTAVHVVARCRNRVSLKRVNHLVMRQVRRNIVEPLKAEKESRGGERERDQGLLGCAADPSRGWLEGHGGL